MAAAEYYSGGQSPPSRPPLTTYSTPPYPMSDAPPPYTSIADSRPHSQPPPARPASDIYRPHPSTNSDYPPEKQSRPPPQNQQYGGSYNQQAMPMRQEYGEQYKQQHPPPKQEYGGAHNFQSQKQGYGGSYDQKQHGYLQAPGPSAYYNQGPTSNPGYAPQKPHAHFRPERSRDRSRSRSRDRDRDRDRSRDRHRRHHHRPTSHHRPDSRHRHDKDKKKPSTSANTFIGAGGGALIGDAIFPGLGTLGGALLGGLGGRKVGKDKEKEQRRAHGSSNRTRGRSYSNEADYHYADEHRGGRKY